MLAIPGVCHADAADVAVASLLEAADLKGRDARTQAEQRYQDAQKVANDSPVVEYAYGLVLVKLFQEKAALEHFQKASAKHYRPARRAQIYTSMARRQWDVAMEQVGQLAHDIQQPADQQSSPEQATAIARWLGQVSAAGQLLTTQADDVKNWVDVDLKCRSHFQGDLRTAYIEGFEATWNLQEQLQDDVAESKEQAQQRQAEQIEINRQITISAQKINENSRDQLKTTAESAKSMFEDKIADVARQLGGLEKTWNQQDAVRTSLERSILIANQEFALIHNRSASGP